MCPANSTLVGRPRSVRASTELPTRIDLEPAASARSAASIASAIGPSVPETDGMSTSAAVSRPGAERRSRAGAAEGADVGRVVDT